MAGGYGDNLSRSTLMGSEDGDLSRSIRMGSQESYEYYCEPCDVDHTQVEATFYCNNCHEYMCRKCCVYHKKFKEMSDHNIQDVKLMTDKPPVGKKRSASVKTVTIATHVKDIKVGGDIVSSVLMSTNQLLVADRGKSRMMLVDTGSGRLVSELQLPGQPWQVTRISDTEAAVTAPFDKKIVLLRTQPQLSFVKEIDAQEQYDGIAYMDNMLVVAKAGRVDILDMSGEVLRIISADRTGKKIFTDPRFITVDTTTSSIFVSDWARLGPNNSSKMVKLSKEGRVEATYYTCSNDGGYPNQVTLDSQGMVYLAWTSVSGPAGCVKQMSANFDRVRTIIPDLSALPRALSYDETTQQLYVGPLCSMLDNKYGVVKVYRLT